MNYLRKALCRNNVAGKRRNRMVLRPTMLEPYIEDTKPVVLWDGAASPTCPGHSSFAGVRLAPDGLWYPDYRGRCLSLGENHVSFEAGQDSRRFVGGRHEHVSPPLLHEHDRGGGLCLGQNHVSFEAGQDSRGFVDGGCGHAALPYFVAQLAIEAVVSASARITSASKLARIFGVS